MSLITATEDLEAACLRMAHGPFVTVDTEFLRETTFWPILCVVQLATDQEALAIDALAEELDLQPLLRLMADEGVVKVFHAARQDLEIFWKLAGVLPTPLFDTQVAAMVCGYGEQVSYSELTQSICGVTIDKSSRFTDWARRPLAEAQIEYAIGDVTHLREIYKTLIESRRNARAPLLARRRDEGPSLAGDLRATSRARLGALQDPRPQTARPGGADGACRLA